MPGMVIQTNVDDKQVRELFDKMPPAFRTRLMKLVEGGAIDVQREMRIGAPVAVTGHLRGSVRYTIDRRNLQATIEPAIDYADDVEKGSKPRLVSVSPGTPLRRWAEQKHINPWALQASIAKSGTKPHPFVGPTYTKMKPQVERQIADGIKQFASEADNGRL